jgi:predicted 2-oxoglutarate/Fe(II)-dependent dioxygenase YbiX
MAFQSYWYQTNLPEEIIKIVEEDIKTFDESRSQSYLTGDRINTEKRKSENAWIPTTHWVAGLIWHYVQRANRENFLYDLNSIDNESLQYTFYHEGQFYEWHTDSSLSSQHSPASYDEALSPPKEFVRKLSVVLQLSDPESYEGGNLEIQDYEGGTYTAPREKGTIIMFDSRALHRVTPVTKGIRKSIVGWVVGPRWR